MGRKTEHRCRGKTVARSCVAIATRQNRLRKSAEVVELEASRAPESGRSRIQLHTGTGISHYHGTGTSETNAAQFWYEFQNKEIDFFLPTYLNSRFYLGQVPTV